MPKGHEDNRSGKKKAKFTLKEKRLQKKEKKEKNYHSSHEDVII